MDIHVGVNLTAELFRGGRDWMEIDERKKVSTTCHDGGEGGSAFYFNKIKSLLDE